MLEKQIKNKKIETEDVTVKAPESVVDIFNGQDFFFPDYNLIINAETRVEAEQKLAEILKAKEQ